MIFSKKTALSAGLASTLTLGLAVAFAWKRFTSARIPPPKGFSSLQPPHVEVLSSVALEQKARALAGEQRIIRRTGNLRKIKAKLDANENALLEAYRTLGEDASQKRAISPAAEWL